MVIIIKRLLFIGSQILTFGILLTAFAFFWAYFYLLISDSIPPTFPIGFTFLMTIVVLMVLEFILPRFYDDRKFEKVQNILFEECDAPRFVEIIEKLLRKRNIEDWWIVLMLNLSIGCLSLHDTEKAKQIFNSIRFFPNNRAGAVNKVIYYDSYFALYFYLHDLEKAAFSLEQMKSAVEDKRIKGKCRDGYLKKYRDNLLLLNAAQSNCQDAEQKLNELSQNAENVYMKVHAQFYIGKAYQYEGKTDEARAAFAYVAEHGNKLYIAQEAREYLGISANA